MTAHVMIESNLKHYVKGKLIQSKVTDPNVLVLDELGIGSWGANRVDIAIISDNLSGYELKSDQDNMKRLGSQAQAFSKVMDRMTLVVGSKHLKHMPKINETIPDWWGLIVATIGKRGSISFKTVRRAKLNKEFDDLELLKFLWKDELLEIAQPVKKRSMRISSRTKDELVEILSDCYDTKQIKAFVIEYLKNRTGWRER